MMEFFNSEAAGNEMSRNTEQGNFSGPVLVAIESLRRDVNTRLDNLKNEISQIADAQIRSQENNTELSAEVRAGLSSIRSLAEDIAGSGPPELKGKRVPRQTLPLLPYAAGFDRAVSPLLTWSIIVTVVSYVRKMPSLRFWVSESMWAKMAPHADILDNSEGLAMLLFSAKNNSKAKLATPPGRMWTFLLQRTLRTVLISARTVLFRKLDCTAHAGAVGTENRACTTSEGTRPNTELPTEPEWMSVFKDNALIVKAVDESMKKFSGSVRDVSASSATVDSGTEAVRPRAKRRKRDGSGLDADHESRLHIVKQIRTMWLDRMNNGRTAARAYLYKSLVFILDKIGQFKDVDRASQKGYKIVLHKKDSDLEYIEADTTNLQGTIWDISDANVDESQDSDRNNSRELQNLKERFPSLHATVTYKKVIDKDTNEADPGFDGTHGAEYVSVTQEVSFHDVAIEMVMEIHSCDDGCSVLAMSELSLKAVHVLAIALRGLVVSVLDQWRHPPVSLSTMESAAFGTDVTLDDEKKVAVMTERRLKKGTVSDTYNAAYRDKFITTETEAECLRRSGGTRERRRIESERAAQDIPPMGDGDIGVEEWLRKK